MQLAATTRTPPLALGRLGRAQTQRSVVTAAKKMGSSGKQRLDSTGYIVDNTNRGNIFAVEPRQLYTSSPRADRAASQGLGGMQGLLVLAGVLGVVAVATLGVAGNSGGTLEGVAAGADAMDGLGAIAARLSAGL